MAQLTFRRKLALAVLALALLAPWSARARPLGSLPAEPPAGLVARLTEWITAWLGEIGCSMDPGGLCRDTPTNQLDVGCSADPGGVPCRG